MRLHSIMHVLKDRISFLSLYVLFLVFVTIIVSINICWSLEPREILLITNKDAPESLPLAHYYMKKRGIPEGNVVELSVSDREESSREEYEKKVAWPVRTFLRSRDKSKKIRCLVTFYGVHLAIADSHLSLKEKAILMV
ncbi:MAG: TIGR03790 family protein, partial [Syntrophales bacterium]|nr:TIGR03790 family protein [Syntrophales bacterium]